MFHVCPSTGLVRLILPIPPQRPPLAGLPLAWGPSPHVVVVSFLLCLTCSLGTPSPSLAYGECSVNISVSPAHWEQGLC